MPGPSAASVYQPVAFFHNQPAFMMASQGLGGAATAANINELQMMGAINPVRHYEYEYFRFPSHHLYVSAIDQHGDCKRWNVQSSYW